MSYNKASLLLCTLLAIAGASNIQATTAVDDLFIGFNTTGSLNTTKDYLIDIGQASTYLNNTTTILNIGNIGADIASLYGSSWYNNTGILWGAIAGANIATGTDATGTLYASTPTTAVGTAATAWLNSSSQTPAASAIFGMGDQTTLNINSTPGTATGANINSSYIQNASDANSWNTLGGTVPAFGFFNSSIEAAFTGSSAGSAVLDLFRLPLGGRTTSGKPGSNVGYLAIDNSGNITYTPYAVSTNAPTKYTGPLLWTGGSGSWSGTNNWISNTVATNGSVVGIKGAGGIITNDAVNTLGSLTYSNTAGTYTLTGSNIAVTGGITNNSTNTQTIGVGISGTGAVVQASTGTLALTASNSYTGGTTVSAGTLVASTAHALGASNGTLNVTGGFLNLNGKTIVMGSTTLSGGSIGNGTMIPSAVVTSTGAINATLSGTGSLAKYGAGTLTLWANDSAFTGAKTINAGTLMLNTNSTLGGAATVAAGATMTLNTGASLSTTNAVHTISGTLKDNSGLAFTNSIKGSVALAGNGTLQKTYAASNSVAGFGASLGGGVSFKLLAGYVTNASTLTANLLTNGQNGVLNFKGTYGNGVVLAFSGTTSSTIKWWDTNIATPVWTNTIAGNTGNVIKSGYQGFTGSFSTFLLSNSISTNSMTWVSGIMGAYGYDSANKTAWAVIDHNSLFDAGDGGLPDLAGVNVSEAPLTGTTIQAVPEPSTYALFLLGGMALAFAARKRVTSVEA